MASVVLQFWQLWQLRRFWQFLLSCATAPFSREFSRLGGECEISARFCSVVVSHELPRGLPEVQHTEFKRKPGRQFSRSRRRGRYREWRNEGRRQETCGPTPGHPGRDPHYCAFGRNAEFEE